MTEQCLTCHFSCNTQPNGPPYLICRRYPPVAAEFGRGSFPLVEKEAWCGEYRHDPKAPMSPGPRPKPSFSHGRGKAVVESVKRRNVSVMR